MTTQEIADHCLRAMQRILRDQIKCETCPVKKAKAEWKKQEVLKLLLKSINDDIK